MTLREIRDKLGLTQAKMAAAIGCELSTYQHWEIGAAKPRVVAFRARIRALELRAQKGGHNGEV